MQQYNLRGIGSKGTIFAGIATYTYTYDGQVLRLMVG